MDAELGCRAFAAALLSWALFACTSVPSDAGFAEAATLARERGGLELAWRRGGEGDAEIERRVRDLAEGELTVDSAVEIALLANRRLQAVYAELGLAQAEILAAARWPNPILDAALRFPEGGGESAIDLAIRQPFLAFLWMPLKKRMAADAFEEAQLRVASAALSLAVEVRVAFRRVQARQQELELRATSFDAADASLELTRRLHAAGNLRDLDLALEEVRREEARVAVADAELAVAEARETLVAQLGVFGADSSLRVGGRLPELPSQVAPMDRLEGDRLEGDRLEGDGLEGRAVANSLDLAARRLALTRGGRALGLAERQRLLPGLELGVEAERDGDGGWEAGPSLSLPLPIFSQNQPELRRAAAELERLRDDYFAEAVELRSRVRRTAARVGALHARASFLRDVLMPLRAHVLDGLQLEYNAMQEGAFRLLVAKREEIATAAEYLTTLEDYWAATIELDGLLEGAAPRGSPASGTALANTIFSSSSSDTH